jgi:hypothetical protein
MAIIAIVAALVLRDILSDNHQEQAQFNAVFSLKEMDPVGVEPTTSALCKGSTL